jgi:excisionase family DNA binding protein
MSEIVVITPVELKQLISDAITEALQAQQAKPLPADKLLTREEVSKMLRISKPTLDAIVKRNELTPIRSGRQVRFGETAVRAFMKGNK